VDGRNLRPAKQKIAGRKRYPLVLMLEPLFRCNLACAGCGKIQYPAHILKKNLSPEECFKAVEECGAPVVSIPGGEPLMHPQIGEIVEAWSRARSTSISAPTPCC
jgi:MoaA/NifB/PqqE/SkfB family radical SAM enzyme